MEVTKKNSKNIQQWDVLSARDLMYRFPSSACKRAYADAANRSIVQLHCTVLQLSKNRRLLHKLKKRKT